MKNYKKLVAALFTVIFCCLYFCGCNSNTKKQPQNPPSVTDDTQKSPDSILYLIHQSNNSTAIRQKYTRIAYNSALHKKNETIENSYFYIDSQKYVKLCGSDITILEDGISYGFNGKRQAAWRMLFIDNAFEEYAYDQYMLSGYSYIEKKYGEKVVEQYESDGVIYLKTSVQSVEPFSELFEYCGYIVTNSNSISLRYELDSENIEILKFSIFIKENGNEIPVRENTKVPDCEEYKVDENLHSTVFSEDKRNITLIEIDKDSNEVATYTASGAKGAALIPKMPYGYDSNYYTDKTCKYSAEDMVFENLTSDITLYITKIQD